MVNLSLPDGSDVAQSLLSRGLVQRSPAPGDEEQSSQFHPRKPGPRKAKPFISKRSVTETRSVRLNQHLLKLHPQEISILMQNAIYYLSQDHWYFFTSEDALGAAAGCLLHINLV